MELPSQSFFRKFISLLVFNAFFGALSAQNQLELRILDPAGSSLPFAHVRNLHTEGLFAADSTGTINIRVSSLDDTLEFRFIGYEMVHYTARQLYPVSSVVLHPSPLSHREVTVIGRMGLHQNELPYEVINIKSHNINSVPSSNTADVLEQAAGVFIQKSQGGGGSPILRGFEANKLLLVIDGTRLNNSIYRSGHLHNAISIDPASLQRIEVILGPNALLYGSDALGGVIHFKTKKPEYRSGKQLFYLHARAALTTATHERAFHLDGSGSKGKHGFFTSISYNSFGDILSGKRSSPDYPDYGKRRFFVKTENGKDTIYQNPNPYLQIGTAYKQWHFLQKWSYFINPKNQLTANFHYASGSDIPRYDQLNQLKDGIPKWSEWKYGPMQRSLGSLTWDNNRDLWFSNKFKIIASFQNIHEERIKRKFNQRRQTHQREHLGIGALTMDFQKEIDRFYESEWSYGLDLQVEKLRSSAFSKDIVSLEQTQDVLTRYPDDHNESLQGGLYALFNAALTPEWKLQAGGRWSFNRISMQYRDRSIIPWPDEYYEGLTNSNTALTATLGINWTPKDSWLIRALAGTAFRTPNIDDIAKIRIKNEEILVPNPGLKPEKTTNFEASVSKRFESYTGKCFKLSLTGFYTGIKDAIVRRDFHLPGGQSTWRIDGESYMVRSNLNAGRGQIKGASLVLKGDFNEYFSFESSHTKILGQVFDSAGILRPLAHIPPLYGLLKLNYQYSLTKWKFRYEFFIKWRYNGIKPIAEYAPSSSDNLKYATPTGTPAWHCFDTGLELIRPDVGKIQIGVNNLFDIHYRPFGSGVSAPGRNFHITLSWNLKKSS